MTCPHCEKGRLRPGSTSFAVRRAHTALAFDEVPADTCNDCGREYFEAAVVAQIEQILAEAIAAGVSSESLPLSKAVTLAKRRRWARAGLREPMKVPTPRRRTH